MHDIGKLVVPNHLLNKPGKLTAEEFARVRMHEAVSAEMLSHIDFLAPVAHSSLSEHTVYQPDDAKHPIEPYIVMVADAYDAMTSTRSYRQALPHDVAIAELRDKAGIAVPSRVHRGADPRPRARRQGARGRRSGARTALGHHASRGRSRVGRPRRPASRTKPRSAGDEGAGAHRVGRRRQHHRGRDGADRATAFDRGGAVLLAAGAVLGELLVLRLDDGTGLPLSYAVLLVLVACFEPLAVVALVVGAELVAIVVRVEPRRCRRACGSRSRGSSSRRARSARSASPGTPSEVAGISARCSERS